MWQRCSDLLLTPEIRFWDELRLDLEEGYQDSTYEMFDEVRVQIEHEDLAKNKEV